MPLFQYKGRDARGEVVRGRLEAPSADAVATQLFNSGVTPVDIVQGGGSASRPLGEVFARNRVEAVDLIFFCQQMYSLLKAGVPIMQALRGLRDTATSPVLARVIGGVAEGLDAGQDLTAALRRYPQVFSTLFVSMVEVGETTGNLERSFSELVGYLERDKETRDRIRAALRYPAFVLTAIALAMVIINVFVIPAFADIYAGFDAELPWATQVLIAVSGFFVAYWPLLLGALAVAVVGFVYYVGTEAGRMWWDRAKLRLPVVGRIIDKATLARFARSLSITAQAGVPIVQAMAVVSRAVDNVYVGEQILQMRDGIERGDSITRTATVSGLFPPTVLQMIAVGEETGAVDRLMQEVADYYDRSVNYDLATLSAAIEPILTVAIAILVLMLALGVFLPMWDLAATIQRR